MLKRFIFIAAIEVSAELTLGNGGFQTWEIMLFLYNRFISITHVFIVFYNFLLMRVRYVIIKSHHNSSRRCIGCFLMNQRYSITIALSHRKILMEFFGCFVMNQ